MSAVSIHNRQRAVALDLNLIRQAASAALPRCLNREAAVEISLVSDRVSARIHRQFMNIAGATDVITFEHGELVISAPTAARMAREHGETIEREIARYIVHGLLHLKGYDDATPDAAEAMWQAQEAVLSKIWPEA